MCQLLFTVGLLTTCLRWTSAAAVPGPVYVAVDGTAVLHPGSDHTGDIKTVTWKYGADKAAELDGSVTICYQQFKGRCELNLRTGELTIKHLTLSDSGFYSVEISNIEVNTVQLWVMYRVSKPSVFTWCDVKKTYCLLTCEGTSSIPESLQYRWNEENDWSHSVKVLNITKENKEPEFSCELKNTVSSSRSDPVQNPFITAPVPKPSVSTWCDPAKTYCLLTCEGTTSEPELLQYRWKEENDWSHSVKVLKITKENKEPEFSCELKNPVSSSRSDPVQNPFITGSLLWIIAVVLVILLIVIVAVVLYYKRKHICQKEADAEKNEEMKLDQQKQRVQPPTSRPGTVYEEVDGTAVLHPGSEHTGNIQTVTWKHNGYKVAEWDGMDVLFYRHSHKGRCELNTRTGELTINHLTLSDSGFYSAEINSKETNTVQLQVMKEAGDEEEPGETTELLSQSGGVQQESRGGGVQQESRGGGVQLESRGGGVQQESRGDGVQQESRGGGVQQESTDGAGVQQESRGGGVQQESRGDVNDPPDVSSAVTSSSGSSADVHHDSAQSPGAAGSSASSPDSGDKETVYEEVDGTAVLHPGSAHTGDITSIIWEFSGSTVAELYGGGVFFYEQFEGRCELNTRTGELTIKHLTLLDSGSYSVKINGRQINTVKLQVTNNGTSSSV